MKSYNPTTIEKKWQKKWQAQKLYQIKNKNGKKPNEMLLVEFPYPSGNLHVGHWYAFAIPDILARQKRMQGINLLYPIGFDAFGLPAENAAIKHGLNPAVWTESNMKKMRSQILSMGTSFDWSREVITCHPDYYRWTQWIFIQFFKKGLAYQKETPVNWCSSCKTVLANEQVVSGACERCDTNVEQRSMLQWNLRITEYADRLIDDLNKLDWPSQIKESQKNWIGRSEGAEIDFKIQNGGSLRVFTTRPDTLFGVTYMVVAPDHAIVNDWLENDWIKNADDARKYIAISSNKTDLDRMSSKEKTGIQLEGVFAVNPANNAKVPVYIADYVLAHYGTGAIMAVPAHDDRDLEFANAFGLPVKSVVHEDILINSGEYDGLTIETAKKEITKDFGKKKKTYKLRDWIVSRQRYWGVPIPIVHCAKCGAVPVKEKDLPVKLPKITDYLPADTGHSPLAKDNKFVQTKCPQCGGGAKRETDTLDTFVDSSWYFLRYCDPKNSKKFADRKKTDMWLPVSLYSGGAEHTTMHLLYSRFWHKAMCDLGLVRDSEPYAHRMNRSLIMGPDGVKMSKSRGNVIDPDAVVARLGADTVRMYLAFIGPYNEVASYPWNPDGVVGVRRFLDRVWRAYQFVKKADNSNLNKSLHRAIEKVSRNTSELKFNTAISALMILLNDIEKEKNIGMKQWKIFLMMMAPFAPHISEELWHIAGEKKSVHLQKWPKADKKHLADSDMTIVVQVNGKVRGQFVVDVKTPKEQIINLAKEAVTDKLADAKIKKEIYVPGKLVSLVV